MKPDETSCFVWYLSAKIFPNASCTQHDIIMCVSSSNLAVVDAINTTCCWSGLLPARRQLMIFPPSASVGDFTSSSHRFSLGNPQTHPSSTLRSHPHLGSFCGSFPQHPVRNPNTPAPISILQKCPLPSPPFQHPCAHNIHPALSSVPDSLSSAPD